MTEGLSDQPQVIKWYNRYELDSAGMPLPQGEQYGGGGPMSPDYARAMRSLAATGRDEPWTVESQIHYGGCVLVHPSTRATYIETK